jgi:hypothetical protein
MVILGCRMTVMIDVFQTLLTVVIDSYSRTCPPCLSKESRHHPSFFPPTPHTVVSASFSRTLSRASSHLFLTTPVHPHGSCSTVFACSVSAASQFDGVLGNDWAGLLRESLVSIGYVYVYLARSILGNSSCLIHVKKNYIPLPVIHTLFFFFFFFTASIGNQVPSGVLSEHSTL